ncbi:GTPase RsgA [Aureimonas sp. Leaf454]|uniref:ribosome small subunit-dependent GTPase A n=1 Tax=Aureimonas sp. Leaf454 TaxID=1736381 RepID=UPI000701AA20|nr:ribosome small subunit-dependent GTPase A [Aureimonas sp. Leaf454]KQT43190.1 GTPase RsgA [Aureimonas sp. Leaf454]
MITGDDISAPLPDLGWSAFFSEQIAPEEADLVPARVTSVHRARIRALSAEGPVEPVLPPQTWTSEFAVGDFVLLEPGTALVRRRLDRRSVVERRVSGSDIPQLAGANIDTLFIVTSCNADFNPARLERYLALANKAGTTPVILLTKADLTEDLPAFEEQARALQRGLDVVVIHPKSQAAIAALARWCIPGSTAAVVGSSGVGKSTLVNTLLGEAHAAPQETGSVREHDAKGRHTTTARSLHRMAGGGWILDSPGIRSLQISDVGDGLDTLFAEITELAPLCRFRACSHTHEPGCAVLAAVAAGEIDPRRLERWRKLSAENAGQAAAGAKRSGGAGPAHRRRR